MSKFGNLNLVTINLNWQYNFKHKITHKNHTCFFYRIIDQQTTANIIMLEYEPKFKYQPVESN